MVGYPPVVTMADGETAKELLVGYDLEILEGKGYVEVHEIRSNGLKRFHREPLNPFNDLRLIGKQVMRYMNRYKI